MLSPSSTPSKGQRSRTGPSTKVSSSVPCPAAATMLGHPPLCCSQPSPLEPHPLEKLGTLSGALSRMSLSFKAPLCSKGPMEPSLTCCSFLCSSCSGLGPADHVPCPPQSPSFLLAGFPCEQSSWSSGMRSSLCLSSEAHKATATAGWMNGGMDGWMSGAVKTVSK